MESIVTAAQAGLQALVDALSAFLFYNIGGFPFIVLWLIIAALFFTVYLRGVNFRLFGHAIAVASGKYDTGKEKGEVKPISALLSALHGAVGLGSIAGISVGVAVGGPGTVFWILVAGMLGMASKFAEVTLSMCYRQIGPDGKVFGGPFQYLKAGMAEHRMPRLGKALALTFAIFCLGGALGGGNMFQSNQAVQIITKTFAPLADLKWMVSLIFALMVLAVLLGSIKRVAKVADIIVPAKGILYLLSACVVIGVHIQNLPATLALIFQEAFTGHAAAGGFIGMLAMGFKRANFANEAGLGSAPIAHAAAQTDEPVREASLALLEPFFVALIGLLTGLMVTITGAWQGAAGTDGVMIASKAFADTISWLPALLALNVFLFAYSTTVGWSYYGEMAWTYLFGRRGIKLYYLIYCSATFLGGVLKFGVILDFSDLLILGMALPNIVALYIMRRRVKDEMIRYQAKYLAR